MAHFRERQLNIRKTEIELQSQTQSLLIDLLSSMTFEQLENVSGLELESGGIILNITPYNVTIESFEENVVEHLYDMSQTEQKSIIDFIIMKKINV